RELDLKMRECIEARGLSSAAERKRREAARRWPALREFLAAVTDATPRAQFSEEIQKFREAARPTPQGRIRETIKELDRLIWDERLRCRVPQIFFDLSARHYARELIEAVASVERRLDEEKRRRSALDFDDLQLRALRLLEDHPEVLRRTGARYRFFLVDEFQDTNGLQRDLMAKLALGSTDFSLSDSETQRQDYRLKSVLRSNLFIVGDRKQS